MVTVEYIEHPPFPYKKNIYQEIDKGKMANQFLQATVIANVLLFQAYYHPSYRAYSS